MLKPPAAALLLLVVSSVLASPGRIARDGAQLRGATGFGGAVLAMPAQGSAVDVLERSNEWTRVKLADGSEGWLHELYVADSPGDVPMPAADPAPRVEPAAPPPSSAPPASVALPPAPSPSSPGCDEIATKLLAQNGELFSLRAQAEAQRMMLAESGRAAAMLQDRLDEAVGDRDIARAALDAAKAASREEGFAAGRAQGVADAQADLKSDSARNSAIADARAAEHVAVMQSEGAKRAEMEARHAQEIADLEARHRATMESFIAMVTQKHDDALARETAAIEAECERRVIDANRENERALRIARRDSGYEVELDKEVRSRLDVEIEEAKARWEAKQRGEMYDVERARREEGDRVRRECEGQRLAAVNAAVAEGNAAMAAALAKERQEADMRCEMALALVLERAAQGGDMKKVRELGEATARRRSGDPVNEPPPPVEPEPDPIDSPRPVPVDPKTLRPVAPGDQRP